MKVVVVGAGLAGLRTADHLARAGCAVELIEAGNRPGGRARTVYDRFAGGQYVESGAEWVDTDHHRMLELMARFGVEPLGEAQAWTVIRRMLYRAGRVFTAEELRELNPTLEPALERYDDAFEAIADGIVDPAQPHLHPDAAYHDNRSMLDVINDLGLDEIASLFAHRNSQGEFADEPLAVSSLFVGQQRAHGRVEAEKVGGDSRAHRVNGGLVSIVRPYAASVEAAMGRTVAYGELLTAVNWNSDGVEVHTDRRVMVADRVVLACSLVPLRAVRFDPVLPAPLARAIAELGYGTVTKTALQYSERFWPAGYANTTLASQRIYEPTAAQAGDEGVLMAYTGGAGGRRLAEHDEAERMRAVAGDIAEMYGPSAAPLGGFSRAWNLQPRFGGSYAAYAPGQVTAFWQVLREPCGPIHLAGEHTATWTGYLEGALESGERAAAACLLSPPVP